MLEQRCNQTHTTIDEALAHARQNLGHLPKPMCGTRGGQIAEVPGGMPLGEEAVEAAQEVGEGGPECGNLLLRHPTPSGAPGENHRKETRAVMLGTIDMIACERPLE
jgi:hypothetical protein